jgi:coxsackievirus/adenovirus receptor
LNSNISGLLLYNGEKVDGSGDFISLGLVGGIPEFRSDVGSGPAIIQAAVPIPMGQWSTIKLTRNCTGLNMMVDSQVPKFGNVYGEFQGLDLIEPMYVGGVPDFNQIHRLTGQTKKFVGELLILACCCYPGRVSVSGFEFGK